MTEVESAQSVEMWKEHMTSYPTRPIVAHFFVAKCIFVQNCCLYCLLPMLDPFSHFFFFLQIHHCLEGCLRMSGSDGEDF